jgi:hypothetical protein
VFSASSVRNVEGPVSAGGDSMTRSVFKETPFGCGPDQDTVLELAQHTQPSMTTSVAAVDPTA